MQHTSTGEYLYAAAHPSPQPVHDYAPTSCFNCCSSPPALARLDSADTCSLTVPSQVPILPLQPHGAKTTVSSSRHSLFVILTAFVNNTASPEQPLLWSAFHAHIPTDGSVKRATSLQLGQWTAFCESSWSLPTTGFGKGLSH